MDGVPNTSLAESRSAVPRPGLGCSPGLQAGREETGPVLHGGQHPATEQLCCLPGTSRSLANKNLTNRAFHSSAGSRLLPQLTSRQGNESHDFTAKAARLCSGWLSDGKGRCFLYPDTINTFLVTCKTVLPLLWPQIPPHSMLDATGSRSHYSHFTLAVTGL